MLREQAEREQRKAEKERIKKEKEEEKKRLKRIEHKKKLKHKQNQRYYKKVKAKRLQENKAIEENQATVKFPVQIHEGNEKRQKDGERSINATYEIMILQRTPEGQQINSFRNKSGKFIPNIIIDDENYTIIAKHEWLVEETFNVYGYHPVKDRKTFDFVLNEMVLKDCERDNIKRIFSFNNRVLIQYDSDIDIITCKTASDAKRLYSELKKTTDGNKFLIFTEGMTSKNISTWVLNKLEEKTGWKRSSCKRIHTL